MLQSPHDAARRLAPLLALSLGAVVATSVRAEDAPPPVIPDGALDALPTPSNDALPADGTLPVAPAAPTTQAASVSQSVTVNLINRLVKRGVLTQEDAGDLMKLAEADAAAARTQQEAMQAAVAEASAGGAPAPAEGDVRVTYLPEPVKAQMRDEIKREVLAEYRDHNWAQPRALPDWVKKFDIFGDFRLRYEGTFFPDGNDNTGAFPNFNAINTGAPYDTRSTQFAPQLNVDEDRQRLRLRARIGAGIELEDGFSAGFRLATGENNSPVSTNQSMGLANQGQGGSFSKYAVWLDRAFLTYNFGDKPYSDISIDFGRFENPFFSSEVMWDDDVGFDGIAARGKFEVTDRIQSFATIGAFPIFNTDFNFSSNQPGKFESTDKWLYGAQIGIDWKINDHWKAKMAVAYYDFQDVEGRLSTPFTPLTPQDAGDTDNTRPSFAQKGNTYRYLRNIIPTVDNNNGQSLQYQYYGLATPFQNLTLTGRLDYDGYEPLRVSLFGEFIKNVAFDEGDMAGIAVNNRGPAPANGLGAFEGGDTAWFLNLQVGHGLFDQRGDWNTFLGYRYVESDAVVDAFTDSDFGGGGTNMKGFTLGANYALSPSVRVGARWMSADQIAGPTLKSDIIQVDLHAKF